MTNLLKVEHLSKQFKGHPVVKDISFNIEEGHCVALLGPNGAGKTTTLHMLTGLLKATSGHIRLLVNGQEVADPRQYIGYLPQTPTFYPWMTGQEFVQYSAELSGLTLLEARGRTKEWLEQVGLTDAARRKIGGYSGGMKQRLGFAQALIHEPKLLILDEPVSALDPAGRRDVLNLLQDIRKNTTVLFSTHVLHDAEEICDDIILIRDGHIAMQGGLDDIRRSYSEPIITIRPERSEGSQAWMDSLIHKEYVTDVQQGRDEIKLTVSNMDQAQVGLLEDALLHHVKLRTFEAGSSTLEDLYLKVVQEA